MLAIRAVSLAFLAALLVGLSRPPEASATELVGVVVGVHDGDTLTLLTAEREQVKVRLAEIDAPESRQPWGARARQALAEMTFGKQVRIEIVDIDHYGRTVGKVWAGLLDANRELVRRGHAWVYRRYLHDQSLLMDEQEAREGQRGLWSLTEADRTPPWAWRRR